jgi:Phage tail tube protein
MATGIPSGLGASLGFAAETTVGTFVTPTRWIFFEKESLALKKKLATSAALNSGLYQYGARRVLTAQDINGQLDLELQDRQMGLLLQHMIGSTPVVTTAGTGAWKQVHNPGTNAGLGLSIQVGRPDITGTVNTFSYAGCKVTDWTIDLSEGAIGKLQANIDGISQSTATSYSAPSFIQSNPLHFAQGALKVGGTASLAGGVTSISGGTTTSGSTYAAAVKQVQIKSTTPVNVNRHTLGSLLKKEQLPNNMRVISGTLDLEFANLTDYYTYQAAATEGSFALELTLTGGAIASSGSNATLDIVIPQCFADDVPINVEGPDTLHQKVAFTAMSDASTTPIQFTYISADSAA